MMDGHDPQGSYNLALSDSSYVVEWFEPILSDNRPAQQGAGPLLASPLLASICDATQAPLASL